MTTRLAIATCEEVAGLTDEDRDLARALLDLGITCVPWVWSSPRPEGIDAVLVRSCWDYHHAGATFVDWIDSLERDRTPLANAPATLRWNMHKGYLLELAARGVAIPETRLVRAGDDAARAVESMPPGPLVVKPCVSMSGWETHLLGTERRGDAVATTRRLQTHGDVLVQAYCPEIEHGEVSIVLFGGKPSHAIRKRPAPGEFRVQSEYGGTREAIEADPAWVATAELILRLAPGEALVGRVDGVLDGGRFVLMELEVIDPMVYLAWAPPRATIAFAESIRNWLARARRALALDQALEFGESSGSNEKPGCLLSC